MIFIVARTYMCAVRIAQREGLSGPSEMSWLTSTMMHKLRGIEDPQVWIADCGLETLTEDDKDMIASRYRTPGAGPSRVLCDG